jgi:hypothetical protein
MVLNRDVALSVPSFARPKDNTLRVQPVDCCTAKFQSPPARQFCLQGVKSGGYRTARLAAASPRLADITNSRVLPVLPVAEPLSLYAPATLACSKGAAATSISWLGSHRRSREIGLRSWIAS